MTFFFMKWVRERHKVKCLRNELVYWENMARFWEEKYSNVLNKFPEIMEQKGSWVNGHKKPDVEDHNEEHQQNQGRILETIRYPMHE